MVKVLFDGKNRSVEKKIFCIICGRVGLHCCLIQLNRALFYKGFRRFERNLTQICTQIGANKELFKRPRMGDHTGFFSVLKSGNGA